MVEEECASAMNKRRLLLLTGGGYHDFPAGASHLVDLLQTHGRFDVEHTQDRHALRFLRDFDGVIGYTHGGVLSAKEERSLAGFVASGKGFLGIHCASASFYPNAQYRAMLGCRFIEHAPEVHTFPVTVSRRDHPLAEGLSDFDVCCEFYHCACDEGLDVFLTGSWKGQPIPLAYTKDFEDGRVCYLALGHDLRALQNPVVAQLIVRGTRWICGL